MDINEALDYLSNLIKDNEWFYDVVISDNKPHRLIVHTHWQSEAILREIPETVAGYQVLVHFVYRKADSGPMVKPVSVPSEPVTEDVDGPEVNINDLTRELDRLEKLCGSNILQDIFYEVQDGKNAVTNLSARYPDVRKSMEKLFEQYGFDVIYEEIDG